MEVKSCYVVHYLNDGGRGEEDTVLKLVKKSVSHSK
jgi:hypothetical protein